jgi:hypothetical protein
MKFLYFFEFFPFLGTIVAYLNPDSKHNVVQQGSVADQGLDLWFRILQIDIRIRTQIFFYFQFNTSKLLPTSVISVPLHLTLR